MILTGYIDLPNAYQVYRKVEQVLKDQGEEDEKKGSAVRLRQFIEERIGYGQDPYSFPLQTLLNLNQGDR
jgi:hypothetical protein